MSLRTIALAASACVAASLTAAPAAAADIVVAPETVTVRVSYADLNLATAEGRARLGSRIAGAARSICGSFFAVDLTMAAQVRGCRADAIASARLPSAYADGSVAVAGNRMSRAAN